MQRNFDKVRTEIMNDITQILAVSGGVMGIIAIIMYEGSLKASLVLHDVLLAGVHLLNGATSGDAYTGIIKDPARCPERWRPIPEVGFLAPSRNDEPVFPTCYFVLRGDGSYGLALPGRMNSGKVGWSWNEQLLTNVALILADAGILKMERNEK
jgi:hypothetical protein